MIPTYILLCVAAATYSLDALLTGDETILVIQELMEVLDVRLFRDTNPPGT